MAEAKPEATSPSPEAIEAALQAELDGEPEPTPAAETPEPDVEVEVEPEPEPDKRNPEKKIEELATLMRDMARKYDKLESKIDAGTATREQKREAAEIKDALDGISDEEYLNAGQVRKLMASLRDVAAPKQLLEEVVALRSSLSEREAKANYYDDAAELKSAYPYEKAVADAWADADKKFPDTDDNNQRKIGYVLARLDTRREANLKAVRARAGKPAVEKPQPPSSKPDTSTKGAVVATGKGASRAGDAASETKDARSDRLLKGALAELFGG